MEIQFSAWSPKNTISLAKGVRLLFGLLTVSAFFKTVLLSIWYLILKQAYTCSKKNCSPTISGTPVTNLGEGIGRGQTDG